MTERDLLKHNLQLSLARFDLVLAHQDVATSSIASCLAQILDGDHAAAHRSLNNALSALREGRAAAGEMSATLKGLFR